MLLVNFRRCCIFFTLDFFKIYRPFPSDFLTYETAYKEFAYLAPTILFSGVSLSLSALPPRPLNYPKRLAEASLLHLLRQLRRYTGQFLLQCPTPYSGAQASPLVGRLIAAGF
ncbi:hypothetical protein Tco_1353699 [Tanacetum coccineum]